MGEWLKTSSLKYLDWKWNVVSQFEVGEDNKTGTMYGLICNLPPGKPSSSPRQTDAVWGNWWWRLYPPRVRQGDDIGRVSTVSPFGFHSECSLLLCHLRVRTALKHFVTARPSELWTRASPPSTQWHSDTVSQCHSVTVSQCRVTLSKSLSALLAKLYICRASLSFSSAQCLLKAKNHFISLKPLQSPLNFNS